MRMDMSHMQYIYIYIYIYMWKAHLKTAGYSGFQIVQEKPIKDGDAFPVINRKRSGLSYSYSYR